MTIPQRLTLTVAVEGCDGTGKSTLAEALASHLRLGLGTPTLKIKRPAPDSEAQRLFGDPLATDAQRLAELDAHLDDLSLILHAEFYAACDRTIKRLKGDT